MTNPAAANPAALVVVASDGLTIRASEGGGARVELTPDDLRCDAMDRFNHTRLRRARILETLLAGPDGDDNVAGAASSACPVQWHPAPSTTATDLAFYDVVHTPGLLSFLLTAHDAWARLGEEGRDPGGVLNGTASEGDEDGAAVPPLVPINMPLARLPQDRQRPSGHVLGQVGYYCNDLCTPVFDRLRTELLQDAGVMERAVTLAGSSRESKATVYAVPTHPGHHAAGDSFGGYCYVNHAATVAKRLQQQPHGAVDRVAILDVDYHCGNGTASIVEADPSLLLVSLHCDPNFDYPFHMGFAADEDDEAGANTGASRTLHLPLPPKTTWPAYRVALETGLARIFHDFQPQALVVSLGLDTYLDDPCALRRAGFELSGGDYKEMGRLIGQYAADTPIVVFVQEGGYRMDAVPQAATDVVTSCHMARQGQEP